MTRIALQPCPWPALEPAGDLEVDVQTDFEAMLRQDEAAILAEAVAPVAQLGHYRLEGAEEAYRRLEALFQQVVGAVGTLDLDGLIAHAERLAAERYRAGYGLPEVLAAFSALEDVMRRRLASRLPADQQTFGVGLVSTALVHGRDAVGHAFAVLDAERRGADLSALFRRSAPGLRGRNPEDLVYPA
jgi:hypothetical protein